jgi:hypothetical protein
MKKTIVVFVVLFALLSFKQAAAQRVTFYYYPSSNVYYNVSTHDYVYYDPGTTTWVTVQSLPATITFTKTPKYTVYYNGPDVWKDNAMHKKKYKSKKTTVKTTTKSNKT